MSSVDFPHHLEGYQLLDVLGQGAMGCVYRARRLQDQSIVAIKTLKEHNVSLEKALRNEGELLGQLNHPNLVKVYEVVQQDGFLFLIMEFVDGVPLTRWIENTAKDVRQKSGMAILYRVALAVHFLHKQTPPVIVRDLKPDNILINDEEDLKLIDFGIARTLVVDSRTELSLKGFASAAYAPLEQYSAQATTTEASDVYSLGATAFHVLTGQPPDPAIDILTQGKHPVEDMTKAGVAPELAETIGAAMRIKAEQRINLVELLQRLRPLAKGPTLQETGATTPPAAPSLLPQLLMLLTLLITLLAVLNLTMPG